VGFQKYYSNNTVFIHRTTSDTVILALVVDDILVIGSDVVGIVKATGYIKTLFVIKDR